MRKSANPLQSQVLALGEDDRWPVSSSLWPDLRGS